MTDVRNLDRTDLEARVKQMYEEVAMAPWTEFHFETGRGLAEHLGYPATASSTWAAARVRTASSQPTPAVRPAGWSAST